MTNDLARAVAPRGVLVLVVVGDDQGDLRLLEDSPALSVSDSSGAE